MMTESVGSMIVGTPSLKDPVWLGIFDASVHSPTGFSIIIRTQECWVDSSVP